MGRGSLSSCCCTMTQPPSVPPVMTTSTEMDEQWRSFDNSVSAISFGFVATAILISMFLLMAIFERFLTTRSHHSAGGSTSNHQLQLSSHGKLHCPSPQMTVYAKGVSVLMPGETTPTFIAHPAPVPCPPEPHLRPFHQHIMLHGPSSSSTPRHTPAR